MTAVPRGGLDHKASQRGDSSLVSEVVIHLLTSLLFAKSPTDGATAATLKIHSKKEKHLFSLRCLLRAYYRNELQRAAFHKRRH